MVIRHMRTDDAAANNQRSFPAPTEATPSLTGQQVFEKKKAANDHKTHIEDSLKGLGAGFWERRKIMKTLSPETLPSLVNHGLIHDPSDRYSAIPENLISDCIRTKNLTLLNDLAAYLNDGGQLPENPDRHIYSKYASLSYLKGLGGGKVANPDLRSFGFNPYSKASAGEREIHRAVIEATRKIDAEFKQTDNLPDSVIVVRLKSYALVEVIKAKPDKTEDLIRLINERRVEASESGLRGIDDLLAAREEIVNPLLDGAL